MKNLSDIPSSLPFKEPAHGYFETMESKTMHRILEKPRRKYSLVFKPAVGLGLGLFFVLGAFVFIHQQQIEQIPRVELEQIPAQQLEAFLLEDGVNEETILSEVSASKTIHIQTLPKNEGAAMELLEGTDVQDLIN
jgi:hypothetical protein